ncbi:SIS domain-containing protein [Actinomadura graeca]|uniref:SIS domain-containing protein n=1 Tax=Actinomadura graeca TaxID=2750812 RepID=A0ABX8QZP0_9ACTN|nr:SIS domain-containing protein [Actinomadura graeca]QXJ24306.1 SIS domain-containing protein [Actinomadura graeca]
MTGMKQLYPFLDTGGPGGDGGGPGGGPAGAGLDAVLADVRRSTAEKAREIVALRATVLDRCGDDLTACAARMAEAFRSGGRLFTFGNGGSSTDAQDVAALFVNPGPPARPLPALALTTDAAVLTALSNDVGFEVVFARQLAAFGRRGDIALALSTSGDSGNLLAALREAGRRGMVTVGLAGDGGGQMAGTPGLDHLFVVPSTSVHRIQEAQTTIYHALWELTQEAL